MGDFLMLLLLIGIVVLFCYLSIKYRKLESKTFEEKIEYRKLRLQEEIDEAREEIGEALDDLIDAVEDAVQEEKEKCKHCNCDHCNKNNNEESNDNE